MQVGHILQDSGLILSARHFQWYCRLTGKNTKLKAGFYEILPSTNLMEIATLLTGGKELGIRITVPEGRASWEIYTICHEKFPELDSARWDSLVHNPDFARQLNVPAKDLEGWLFPETYLFPMNVTERDILSHMVQTGRLVHARLDTGATSKFRALGGWEQVLTLASIVEEETGKINERPHISGVFHNRLRKGIPLGADPTVRFIFRNLTGPIFKSQLASDNPYNTRRFCGLPPGPISNPGFRAIDAALHPMVTEDLYFVARDDGSGEHFFASNLSQHNKFKDLAARNRGESVKSHSP